MKQNITKRGVAIVCTLVVMSLNSFQSHANTTDITINSNAKNNRTFSDGRICYQILSSNPAEAIVVTNTPHGIIDSFPYIGEYEIPSLVSYNGIDYKVIGIDSECFSPGTSSVTLPESLIYIGDSGVYGCSNESLKIPSGLRFIGRSNFHKLREIKEIEIPGSVISIGEYSFSDNYKTEKITFNEGLYEIGDNCFNNNYLITEVILPSSLTKIGNNSFTHCSELQRVVLPKFGSFPHSFFNECPNIREIEMTDSEFVDILPSWFLDVNKEKCSVIIPDETKEENIPDNGFKYVRKSQWVNLHNGSTENIESSALMIEDGIYTLSGIRIVNIDDLKKGDCYIRISAGVSQKLIK